MADLILTNGDNATNLLTLAGKRATIVPWRDVLHEGPIVFDLAGSSKARVAFLAERFRIDPGEVAATFAERDAVIRGNSAFERIELWFEHDLYDQLQLMQILAFLADEGRSQGVHLVQADNFLGHERPDTILRFARGAREIDADDLDLAETIWADLAMPTPEPAFRHLAEDDTRFPFLASALSRFLEELPAPDDGLSRTERTALTGIAAGHGHAAELFRTVLASEPAAFMGDESFFALLGDLAAGQAPLITGLNQPVAGEAIGDIREANLSLTDAGREVLGLHADRIALNGIDRWWAGTRLAGHVVWRYDLATEALVPPGAPRA